MKLKPQWTNVHPQTIIGSLQGLLPVGPEPGAHPCGTALLTRWCPGSGHPGRASFLAWHWPVLREVSGFLVVCPHSQIPSAFSRSPAHLLSSFLYLITSEFNSSRCKVYFSPQFPVSPVLGGLEGTRGPEWRYIYLIDWIRLGSWSLEITFWPISSCLPSFIIASWKPNTDKWFWVIWNMVS